MKFYDIIHYESRSDSVNSVTSSTPSTTTCVTPPGQVNYHNFHDEEKIEDEDEN